MSAIAASHGAVTWITESGLKVNAPMPDNSKTSRKERQAFENLMAKASRKFAQITGAI